MSNRCSTSTDAVFSPIRFDCSFEEQINVKSLGGISEELRRPSTQRYLENYKSVESLDKEFSKKVKVLSEENGQRIREKSNKNGSTVCETTKQLPTSNSLKVLKSPNKQFNSTTPTLGNERFKKPKSQKSKDKISNQELSKNHKTSVPVSNDSIPSNRTGKNTDTSLSKFITVRRDQRRNTASVNALPVHVENLDDEKASASQNQKDSNRCDLTSHDLTTEENKSASTVEEPTVDFFNAKVKPEESSTIKIQIPEHTIDKTPDVCIAGPSQPTQVQHNIIEKLISDTVGYEFDGIRLQMYQQQISILKMLNTRMDEFEIKQQAFCEIIAGLLKENQQLKNELMRFYR